MTLRSRLLTGVDSSATETPSPDTVIVDSDFVVILASLLCALICVLGLIAIARCACIRRISSGGTSVPQPPPNKGLKKKILRTLPTVTYSGAEAAAGTKLSDCAICLTEFEEGDEIRVLPQCGHGFHVECIDMWLGYHSSCPSCRQIPVVTRCEKCGELPTARAVNETRITPQPEDDDRINRFLP